MVSRNLSNISDKTLQDGLLLMSSKQSVSSFSKQQQQQFQIEKGLSVVNVIPQMNQFL